MVIFASLRCKCAKNRYCGAYITFLILVTHIRVCVCTGGGQNNGRTKKFRNRIYVGYIERTSVGNTAYSSSVRLHSVVLAPVH
jgi:hypothetical protein